jgi:hypothetical protein
MPLRMKQQLASLIANDDLRKAVRVMDNVRKAHETLSVLPAPFAKMGSVPPRQATTA